MKTPIDIQIRSERLATDFSDIHREPTPEVNSSKVSGFLQKTRAGVRLTFTEQASDGDIHTTVNTLKGGAVSINRDGADLRSTMMFQQGKCHHCVCDGGYFPVQLRICTSELSNSLSRDGGELDIKYTVEIVGNLAETNRLTLSVSPQKNIFS